VHHIHIDVHVAHTTAVRNEDKRVPLTAKDRKTTSRLGGAFGLKLAASAAVAGAKFRGVAKTLRGVGMMIPDWFMNGGQVRHLLRLAAEDTADFFIRAAQHFLARKERGDTTPWHLYNLSSNVLVAEGDNSDAKVLQAIVAALDGG
jgi:hypothetical protein